MFGDQNVASLGGAQVSMRLQRRFLERAGHLVTIVAPAMHSRRAAGDEASIALPSVPITPDGEYSLTWPGRAVDRRLDAALRPLPPVDVVHVQADFWGAFIGHRFAARHGLPVVHTMHNRVDVGIRATTPFPALALGALTAWQRRVLVDRSEPHGRDGWSYLRRFAIRSGAVTAPSAHFARRLESAGVAPRGGGVDVVWNGIDDDVLDAVLVDARPHEGGRSARLVWLGRMSPEKRLLPFLDAFADAGVRAEVEVIGGGAQLAAAQRLVARRGIEASVVFAGRLPYDETLRRIRRADAVVQTSIGFETQGMTVFEAASLGTPAIVSDRDIAGELGAGGWLVGAESGGVDLAETLRRAVADIDAGAAPEPDPTIRERFRQSSRTAAMIDVYERVVAS
jgi:glycosyltransferase involved in cell wall biosynthesis